MMNVYRQVRHPVLRLISSKPLRCFSDKIPDEKKSEDFKFDEKEMFSEANMERVKQTISEKMKAIKAQEELEEEQHVHNPENFEFIKSTRLRNISSGVFAYPGRLDFGPEGTTCIYKTNREIYRHAEYVDTILSGITVYSAYKIAKYAYVLGAFGYGSAAFSLWGFGFWWVALFVQTRYLMATFLTQVFMIDEIQLTKDLQHVRVSTVLARQKVNIFAHLMLRSGRSDIQTVYLFPIKDCSLSPEDKSSSPIMRILI
jgi:hypothetical protein